MRVGPRQLGHSGATPGQAGGPAQVLYRFSGISSIKREHAPGD